MSCEQFHVAKSNVNIVAGGLATYTTKCSHLQIYHIGDYKDIVLCELALPNWDMVA